MEVLDVRERFASAKDKIYSLERKTDAEKKEIAVLKQELQQKEESCSYLSNLLAKANADLEESIKSRSTLQAVLDQEKEKERLFQNEVDGSKLTISKLEFDLKTATNELSTTKTSIPVLSVIFTLILGFY